MNILSSNKSELQCINTLLDEVFQSFTGSLGIIDRLKNKFGEFHGRKYLKIKREDLQANTLGSALEITNYDREKLSIVELTQHVINRLSFMNLSAVDQLNLLNRIKVLALSTSYSGQLDLITKSLELVVNAQLRVEYQEKQTINPSHSLLVEPDLYENNKVLTNNIKNPFFHPPLVQNEWKDADELQKSAEIYFTSPEVCARRAPSQNTMSHLSQFATDEDIISAILQKKKYKGFFLGELHCNIVSTNLFIINNMEFLKKCGVGFIGLEGFDFEQQELMDNFLFDHYDESDRETIEDKLLFYGSSKYKFLREQHCYYHILLAAKKHGMRVVCIDYNTDTYVTGYHFGMNKSEESNFLQKRMSSMNYVAHRVIQRELNMFGDSGKFVCLTGKNHTARIKQVPNVPGLSELEQCPAIMLTERESVQVITEERFIEYEYTEKGKRVVKYEQNNILDPSGQPFLSAVHAEIVAKGSFDVAYETLIQNLENDFDGLYRVVR